MSIVVSMCPRETEYVTVMDCPFLATAPRERSRRPCAARGLVDAMGKASAHKAKSDAKKAIKDKCA